MMAVAAERQRVTQGRPGGHDVAVSRGEYQVHPIGWVRSPLVDLAAAPKQSDEGAPEAELVFTAEFVEGLEDLHAGETIWVLTWLDRARRDVLVVHPRDDVTRPRRGVFSTRSADRPNPIGLHRVEITSIDGSTVRVCNLEAIDGTPIVDVKPTLGPASER
jgi:tRNA-Thr(GGU) m(6)t(6)A37 methyltransferase TsaA